MSESVEHTVDGEQVKKAAKALYAYHKAKKSGNSLLLNESECISLLLTVWKIPNLSQTIRIPLPHGIRPDTHDVCLFTRDEPNMSVEQTEKFYKKLLSQHGVKQITEIIPLKKMKKEYKPFEAKRRLLSSYDLFLADDRIRRLLPSLIGKHFYKEKKEPVSVNLKKKNLAAALKRHIQGTQLHIVNRGCCYAIRVGYTGMNVEHIMENVLAVAQALAVKLPMKWKNVKVLHLKTQSSVALPVYTSVLDSLKELNLVKAKKVQTKKQKKFLKGNKPKTPVSEESGDQLAEEKEEEIPQLIPIQEPSSEKKSKKKKRNIQEGSKVEENCKTSKEKVQVLPTKKPTRQKRKMNGSEEMVKTSSKHKKEALSEEKSGKPEGQETPPKRRSLRQTLQKMPSKAGMKLSKSARKSPQTPKPKKKTLSSV